LWRLRLGESDLEDYPIGPGDLLTVSVFGVEQLQNRHVRVAGDGNIELPFAGKLQVAGLTQSEVQSILVRSFNVYLVDPRVEVFVVKYQNRSVAVVGQVSKPGMYPLSSSDETLTDVIGQAGGLTADAAQTLVFIPARPGHDDINFGSGRTRCVMASNNSSLAARASDYPQSCNARAAARDSTALTTDDPAARSRQGRALNIDLRKPADQACLGIPARPGDVILLEPAGQVMVYGWVRNPGAYKITPGMTVLGAISAAGGATFSSHAQIMRSEGSGERTAVPVDIHQIEKGQSSDLPIAAGDIVLVEHSAIGAVPYAMYMLFSRFGTGVGIGVP
jgi:protein involved in polysaccharide export with SLBB domain